MPTAALRRPSRRGERKKQLLSRFSRFSPIIYPNRRGFEFVNKDDPSRSDHVFNRDEYVYGTDGRCNVGFGFWQLAVGSKADLTKENLRAARLMITAQKGDYGRPLGLSPDLLVVGPTNADAARDILLAERDANGATNTDRNLVEIFETPWLV